MSTYRKTEVLIPEHNAGVLQKLWIVGETLTDNGICLNYIARKERSETYNEGLSSHCFGPPKYFSDFESARACAKFWNQKVDDKYHPGKKIARHGMRDVFKPHLVKVSMA